MKPTFVLAVLACALLSAQTSNVSDQLAQAQALIDQGKLGEAYKVYVALVKKQKDCDLCHLGLGQLLQSFGDYDRADSELDWVIKRSDVIDDKGIIRKRISGSDPRMSVAGQIKDELRLLKTLN
jgi:hypothetical protein